MPNPAWEPLAELVVCGFNTTVEDRDGDLALVLEDGVVLVLLDRDADDRAEQAIVGLERLATVASALAEQLREICDSPA